MRAPPEIVISGISGRFPESENLQVFIDHLLSNKNLISNNDHRFKSGIYGLPKGFGTLQNIDKFDADFFGLLPKQADHMDPQLRMGLETTYEAMFDAGVNPSDERGTRTGVFTAVISHESTYLWCREPYRLDGGNLIGSLGSMLPNRISYCFDFNGPSANYDTACSSSFFALDAAVTAIQTGKCDAAVVMSACLIFDPVQSLMRDQAGMLAKDAKPCSFDPDGLGYVRAEAVAAIYLQKMSTAKKAYAVLVGIGSNTDGYKERGAFHPSAMMQEQLLEEVYRQADINPADVKYVEAHGTGTPAGDPEEVKAISRHFCLNKNRKDPLLLGSVKSNMGHTEGTSGLCSIAKIVGILQTGIIPANLNFKRPHYGMRKIREGQIQVVDKNAEWKGGYIGVSSFGFGGVNTHVILKPVLRQVIPNEVAIGQEPKLQNLITLSGRTFDGVEAKLKRLVEDATPGQTYLLNEINRNPCKSEKYRGYAIKGSETVEVGPVPLQRPSVWFVLNGMGSQWIGMGRTLFQIPTFNASFDKCSKALAEFNYDLKKIYFSDDPLILDHPTNVFSCIGATQICLIDVLRVLGIRPSGMLGHSMGETLCAYADECMTLEETMKTIYLRGKPCEDLKEAQGGIYGMAAVALGAEATAKLCPPGLYTACHNSPNSTTISGSLESIKEFQKKVEPSDVAVKPVNSCGMAFHSPYIIDAANIYKDLLAKFLSPKARSQTWISTSVPKKNQEREGLTFGPDYLYNNFVSPVLFTEALAQIPSDAVIIEVGPSGLLRGLIQKGTTGATVIPLQSRNSDPLETLMKALGKMYMAGINFNVNALIGLNVKTPLPGTTPIMGHLVDWDHSQSWSVPKYGSLSRGAPSTFDVCLTKTEDAYLIGHSIRGKALFPAAGYICLVWKHFAGMNSAEMDEFPVIFENVKFHRVTVLRSSDNIEFRVNVLEASGVFEVKEGDTAVCTGTVRPSIENAEKIKDSDFFQVEKEGEACLSRTEEVLTSEDVYKRLRLFGYHYTGLFRGILRADSSGRNFHLNWNKNWISYLDTCLQTTVQIYNAENYIRNLSVPTEIEKLLLNPLKFYQNLSHLSSKSTECSVYTHFNPDTRLIKCHGIELEGIKMTQLSSKTNEAQPIIANHAFDPYFYKTPTKSDNFTPLQQCISIVMENLSSMQDTITGYVPGVLEICTKIPIAETLNTSKTIRVHFAVPDVDYTLFTEDYSAAMAETYANSRVTARNIDEIASVTEWMAKKYDLIVLDDGMLFKSVLPGLKKGAFVVLKVTRFAYTQQQILERLDAKHHLISHKFDDDFDVFLIRKDTKTVCKKVEVVAVDSSVDWVDELRDAVIRQEKYQREKIPCPRLYLISNGKDAMNSGLLGLAQCLRKEPFSQRIRCIYSVNEIPLDFENPDERLKEILKKDLYQTVVDKDGQLGCYIHFELGPSEKLVVTDSAFVGIDSTGDLSTLAWHEGIHMETFERIPGHRPVKLHVAGLNFKDVMIATGNLQTDLRAEFPHCYQSPLGLEFSGETKDGQRVCGISHAQCVATHVLAPEEFLWEIPSTWSMAEGATIPVVYCTAYLALVVRGRIRRNESILIHSGAGGVGMAAIRIALSYNCTIFTTVSSDKKMAVLRSIFPDIPEENIGFSRETSFEHKVLVATNGKGVDMVLNSLSGDKLDSSVRCLARHGRFLEIGRVDLVKNKNLGMDLFLRDASFHGIQLDIFLRDARPEIRKELRDLIRENIVSGVVKPLPFRLFNKDQVEPAFRYMGQGTHTGKVLIGVREGNNDNLKIRAQPTVYFSANKAYIVLGGLGGVGLEFINWMTLRNARKITITSRTGNLTPYSRNYIKIWRQKGVDIRIIKTNAINKEEVEGLFKETMAMGPIGGIFNLTAHLDIKLMKLQTTESFKLAADPKITITKNLDDISRNCCPELDHFVFFSSVSSGIGFDGQGNYGFANSGAERLIERRVEEGLPGKAIQWGAIGNVGVWHEQYNKDYKRTSFIRTGVQSIESVLKSLDLLLTLPSSPVILCQRPIDADVTGKINQATEDMNLMERMAHILGHSNSSRLNSKSKLVDLGMDSVMSIEIMHVLEKDFGLELSAAEIRNHSLEELNEMSNKARNQSAIINPRVPKPRPATAGLFQLNFFKSFTRTRFIQNDILYPINKLAKEGNHREGMPSVFICNSIEGPDVLRVLGGLTNAPCYALQFTSLVEEQMPFEEVADIFLERIKKTVPKGPYIVAGLSAGVFPAYALALKMQKLGEISKLIWIDMTFERFSAIVDENFGSADISTLSEEDLMIMIHSQVFGFDKSAIEKILREEPTAEGKTDRMVELFQELADGEFDEEGIRQLLCSNWKAMVTMLCQYKPPEMFHQDVGLIKTTQNLIAYDTSELWGLEKYCTKTPEVLVVDTTHSYLIAEPAVRKVVKMINAGCPKDVDFTRDS